MEIYGHTNDTHTHIYIYIEAEIWEIMDRCFHTFSTSTQMDRFVKLMDMTDTCWNMFDMTTENATKTKQRWVSSQI